MTRIPTTTPLPPRRRRRWWLALVPLLALLTYSLAPKGGEGRGEGKPAVLPPPPAPEPAKPEPSKPEPARPEPELKARPPVAKKPPIPVAPVLPTAVLAVGGETLLRGEIFIDGVSRGFAPARFELPIGPHQVEVIGRDQVKHGPREFTLTRQHTPSAPLSWEE